MNEQSIWQLVTGAGPVVKIVLGLLLLASIVSWAMIADRWARLRKANAAANRFEERFWSGVDLNALFREVSADERSTHGMAYIFDAGFREFSRLHQHGRIDQEAILEGTRRAMRVATTLYHELIHSTGHPSRLNRSTVNEASWFGSENYSKEELIAEMGAAFLCVHTGIENETVNNSAAYIAGWLERLRNDQRLVIVAAAQAQRAFEYIVKAH